MDKDKRDIVRLQVTMGCRKDCEGCSKFFDCTSPLKQDIYNNPIHNRIKKKLSSIKYKMAVMSGKGGVGKSTTLVNLVGALRVMGAKIGALDSDFYEPTLPTFFGVKEEEFKAEEREIVPIPSKKGVKVTSVAFTLGDLGYVTWATEQLRWALYMFLGGTDWGELDFLFIDLPPGTGDETLNVLKAIPDLDGVVIVTIPSDVAQIVVGRGISLCKKAGVPIMGVVENMGILECPYCDESFNVFKSGGGNRISDEMGVKFLGTVPLDYQIAEASDEGEEYVSKYPDSLGAKTYMKIAGDVASQIGYKP